MLTHLQISDLAIIDAAEIEFAPALTVLTGETGAGKSIIVDALQLAAGGRAAAEQVRHGAERAEISATFALQEPAAALRGLLDEQSIPYEDELVVRRVVGNDGRSRAYLNGQAVAIQVLRAVGEHLVDIHGQHEFQSLTRASAQRELLDAFGKLELLADGVAAAHRTWLALLNRTLELESRARDRDARLDMMRYQARELEALALQPGEYEQLQAERGRLANRGKLDQAAQLAAAALYEAEDGNAHSYASRALAALRAAAPSDARLAELLPMVDSAAIQIKEAAALLRGYIDSLETDVGAQERIETRLSAIEELARKHRAPVAELTARQAQITAELGELDDAENSLANLRKQQQAALATYQALAKELSAKRSATARILSRDITARMQTLGMPGGRFTIDLSPLESAEPAAHGYDNVEFRVTANPGQPLRAVAKVASGGELSRLSLAVQVTRATRESRCMVFDEVDTGVGGAVAEIVGQELRSLANRGQALCVTHLAQVASQAHQHLRVTKLTDGRSTRIAIRSLTPEERIEELARMLGGIEITSKAREHAREMLQRADAEERPVAKSRSRAKPSA
ncbi:MAG: DNA repair protein RecN [Steroidobacteraceae bacterium]